MKIIFGDILEGRKIICDYVLKQKQKQKFTVIDIGGAVNGWSESVTDVFVDKNICATDKKQFNIDICKKEEWDQVLEYVKENGKFDYSICTHTLEDIYNPYLVLDYLPKISKSGVISTPSINTEVNLVESGDWSGYVHHRYLFGYKGEKIFIAPKLPLIEKFKNRKSIGQTEEIRYFWENDISYDIFMDNYLGPDKNTVVKNFEVFVTEQVNLKGTEYEKEK